MDISQSQIDFFPSFSYKISTKSQISEPFLLEILAGGHHEPPDGCGWAALVRRSGGGS